MDSVWADCKKNDELHVRLLLRRWVTGRCRCEPLDERRTSFQPYINNQLVFDCWNDVQSAFGSSCGRTWEKVDWVPVGVVVPAVTDRTKRKAAATSWGAGTSWSSTSTVARPIGDCSPVYSSWSPLSSASSSSSSSWPSATSTTRRLPFGSTWCQSQRCWCSWPWPTFWQFVCSAVRTLTTVPSLLDDLLLSMGITCFFYIIFSIISAVAYSNYMTIFVIILRVTRFDSIVQELIPAWYMI